MRYWGIILLAVLLISACQDKAVEVEQQTQTLPQSNSLENHPAVAEEFTISSAGIGKAKLGMTLGELKQRSNKDTKFKPESPFMVDLNAIAVSKSGVVQYYILYLAGTTSHPDTITPTDADPITILMTDNPNYQTKEGVKVGTSIQEAEAIYGNATLSYNTANESREYVTFGDRIERNNIQFRTNWLQDSFGGIYPATNEEYRQTEEFNDSAAITAIEVSCAPIDCSKLQE